MNDYFSVSIEKVHLDKLCHSGDEILSTPIYETLAILVITTVVVP